MNEPADAAERTPGPRKLVLDHWKFRPVDCFFDICPYNIAYRGRHGFDVGRETLGACRGTDHLVNPAVTLIVANDDNYALAA